MGKKEEEDIPVRREEKDVKNEKGECREIREPPRPEEPVRERSSEARQRDIQEETPRKGNRERDTARGRPPDKRDKKKPVRAAHSLHSGSPGGASDAEGRGGGDAARSSYGSGSECGGS